MKFDVIECQDGYKVTNGQSELKTPGKNPVVLPNYFLAQELANEWQAKYKDSNKRFFLTPIINTAIDQVQVNKEKWFDECLFYAHHDVVLHWVDENDALYAMQQLEWRPLIDYVETDVGVKLHVATTIQAAPQDDEFIAHCKHFLASLSDIELIFFKELSSILHSFIIPYAYWNSKVTKQELFIKSYLEEVYQMDKWGVVDEQEKRHVHLKDVISCLCRYLESLKCEKV
jgi:chaperone required for assembly of F1-ATPase